MSGEPIICGTCYAMSGYQPVVCNRADCPRGAPMTKPTISDEELRAFAGVCTCPACHSTLRLALADFLARRVPPVETAPTPRPIGITEGEIIATLHGFNACRDIVMNGRKG